MSATEYTSPIIHCRSAHIAHHPLPLGKPPVHHGQHALRFTDVAIARPLVLVLAAGEFVEEAELAEHGPHATDLEEQPLDRLVAPRRILRQELARFVGEVDEDRAGLEQRERPPARACRVEDCRNFPVWIQRAEFR
jgi:hypothetical protein